MILLIDTTEAHEGKAIADILDRKPGQTGYTYIDTTDKKISHCLGCNHCWLKTPGSCVVKDDYEEIMLQMMKADQVWLIADTRFGFVSYKAKNITDRVMPLVTMNLKFEGKQMRHIMRYKHNPDWGLIYTGEGDRALLQEWIERVAINFGTKSLGAYDFSRIEEVIPCMS